MTKNIKNLELFYDHKPQFIAHQRPVKLQDGRERLQDLNFWKIFNKVPRTNSHSLKQNQSQQEEKEMSPSAQNNRLIVISTFKNTDSTSQSPYKHAKMHKNQMKRYISNETFNMTRKISQKQQSNPQSDNLSITQQSGEVGIYKGINQSTPNASQQLKNQSCQPFSKRTVVSGNDSQIKTKYRITKDISKKQNKGAIRINSKIKLPELKEQKKYPMLMKDPEELKEVKSESFIVLEYPSERIVVSNRAVVCLEIASLTKIMTFYTAFSIIQTRGIDIKTQTITVSPLVSHTTGTSAELIEGQIYTVEDMLYGLMLPSGNDAANELAYWAGKYLVNSDDEKVLLKSFVGQMNRQARLLNLPNSKFANPHGLPHQEARSTAADMAKLCCVCMKNQLFKNITSCKKYFTMAKFENGTREVQWENTNKLLRREGFIGLKTGITVTAGPCLAAAYSFRDKIYISVILRAPKVSGRFKQTRLLLHWTLNKIFKDLTEPEKHQLKKLKKHDHDLDSDYSEDEHEFKYDCNGKGQYKKRANILNYEI